jgi:hypothetical protein
MYAGLSFCFAVLALLTVGGAQAQDGYFQIGYAANLMVGDSGLNISNDGAQGGFYPNALGIGNLCVNVYTFDPSEEEVACCACLVTPNGMNSLSARQDLISNTLTASIPTTIVIKLLSSVPGTSTQGTYTICDAGGTHQIFKPGMLAWGYTLEPAAIAGTFAPVNVHYINGTPSPSEVTDLTYVCQFIESQGSGYGICASCGLGALGAASK